MEQEINTFENFTSQQKPAWDEEQQEWCLPFCGLTVWAENGSKKHWYLLPGMETGRIFAMAYAAINYKAQRLMLSVDFEGDGQHISSDFIWCAELNIKKATSTLIAMPYCPETGLLYGTVYHNGLLERINSEFKAITEGSTVFSINDCYSCKGGEKQSKKQYLQLQG